MALGAPGVLLLELLHFHRLNVHCIKAHMLDIIVHWSGLADSMESLNTDPLILSWVSACESFGCHFSERPNDTILRAPPKFYSPPAALIL